MKKIYLFTFISFVTTLVILSLYYNEYSAYYKDEQINAYISKNIDILKENLNFEKQYSLSLSLFISKNSTVKNALLSNNQAIALAEIDNFLQEIKKATSITNIDIQIHTKKLEAFARSWDKSNYLGINLAGFRKGLRQVKKTKKSFVSIELGERLNIKAISPILDNNGNFIGSVEIIMNFENIEKRVKKFDLDMIVLLDKKFEDIAVNLKKNKRIDKYIVVEDKYSKNLLTLLEKHKEIFGKEKFYYKIESKIIVFVPMLNIGIDDIGVIIVSMDMGDNNLNHKIHRTHTFDNTIYTFNKNKREVIIK